MKFKSNLILTLIIILVLALTSCGANNNAIIATSVALTVQAQNTQTAAVTDAPLPTSTNIPLADTPTAGTPAALSTLTPLATFPTASGVTKFCTASATFISETVPDGTIVSPGAQFLKTWTIQNSGTCTWDSTWKFAYYSGDLMGGTPGGYSLPVTPPGKNMQFSISLIAPTDYGTYTGYWKLESPYGCVFGDSAGGDCKGTPYSVQIAVNSGTPGAHTPTVYGITSVTYTYGTTNQKPPYQQALPGVNEGYCTGYANIFLTTWATISSSGPLTITYYWKQSDGGHLSPRTLTFTGATSITVSDDYWPIKISSSDGYYWDEIVVTSPINQTFTNIFARFDKQCL
jgi:hypothetical protein